VKRDQQITKTLLKTFEDVSTSTVIFSKMLSTSKDDNFCP
jgi:predicted alpha/beta hydrolase family esterase